MLSESSSEDEQIQSSSDVEQNLSRASNDGTDADIENSPIIRKSTRRKPGRPKRFCTTSESDKNNKRGQNSTRGRGGKGETSGGNNKAQRGGKRKVPVIQGEVPNKSKILC